MATRGREDKLEGRGDRVHPLRMLAIRRALPGAPAPPPPARCRRRPPRDSLVQRDEFRFGLTTAERLDLLERDWADLALDPRHDMRRRQLRSCPHPPGRPKASARAARSPSGGSELNRRGSTLGAVQTEGPRPDGKVALVRSAESASAKPSAATISAAEGSSETIRIRCPPHRAGSARGRHPRRRSCPGSHGTDRDVERRLNIGPPVTHVKLAVLTAGVDVRRQVCEKRRVEPAPGKGGVQPARVDTDDGGLETRRHHRRGERGRRPPQSGKTGAIPVPASIRSR